MTKDILELANKHKDREYSRALLIASARYDYNVWTEYKDNELKAFLCYFDLFTHSYDMICVTDRDNKYSLKIWKQLSKLLKNRTKEIRIESTPSKEDQVVIDKAIIKYGGYRKDNILIFPFKE